MKRGLKNLWIMIIAGMLSLIMAAAVPATALVSEVEKSDPALLRAKINFGLSQAQTNEVISLAEVFEDAFGFRPSDAELTFLEDLSEFSLIYNDKIPSDRISTTYDREQGSLTVIATEYSYVASNGATVTWVPKSATMQENTLVLDENGACVFNGLLHSAKLEVSVHYVWEVTIPDDVAQVILNEAYFAGVEALSIRAAYLAELDRYNAEMDAYLAYKRYLQLEEDFKQYQIDMDNYEVDLAAFRQYQADYTAYSEQLKLYNDWKHYFEYQDFIVQNNTGAYAAYRQYLQDIEDVEKKLAPLEALYVTEAHSWQFYGSLAGTTVTSVLDNRDRLIQAGCNATDIDNARAATNSLRTLLQEYLLIRRAKYPSKHDKLLARYNFYVRNYHTLQKEFAKLYGSLYALFKNSFVKLKAENEGKLEHFMQFIGQLYITTTALDDGFTRDKNWKIYDLYALEEIVAPDQLVEDSNLSAPVTGEMPSEAVPKVEYVEPIEAPNGDPVYRKPKEPAYVEEPTMPEPVTDPTTVEKPEYAEKPDWEPIEEPLADCLKALAEMVAEKTLTERSHTLGSCRFELETTLSRPVSINNKKMIVFYDFDHKTILDTQELEFGASFSYNGEKDVLTPWSDAQYDYTFRAWTLADGSTPSSLTATGDLSLYASYWMKTRSYTVTWILNGETQTQSYLYGATPKSPFITERESDESHHYVFSGWDREILPVTENTTYTGTLQKIPKQFTVTWIIEGRTETGSFAYGTLPSYSKTLSYLSQYERCDFVGWERMAGDEVISDGLSAITGDTVFRAKFRKTPLAIDDGGNALAISQTDSALVIYVKDTVANFYEAWKMAKEEGLDLIFRRDLFALAVKNSELDAMMGARQLRFVYDNTSDPYGRIFRVVFRNANNAEIQSANFHPIFSLHEDDEGRSTTAYLLKDGEWIALTSNTVIAHNEHLCVPNVSNLTVTTVGEGKANLSAIPLFAEAGAWIDLSAIGCTYGYEVSSATVKLLNGTAVPMKGLTFYMPQEEIIIELNVTKIIYHVIFKVDGVIVSAHNYYLGESILKPKTPTKLSDGVYDYTFSEWSPKVLAVASGNTRELIYEASFLKTHSQAEDPYVSKSNNNRLMTVYLPIGASVVVLLAAGVILFLYIRKRKATVKKPIEQKIESQNENE